MYYIISFFFFFLSLWGILVSLIMSMTSSIYMSFWEFIFLNSFKMEFLILFDWISVMFMSVVFLIFSMIMVYSYDYMSGYLFNMRFLMLMGLFLLSMIFMIMSPNLISIMLGWDGLGLISYSLIILNQNKISYNSGMVTLMMNRVGDIFLLILIGLFLKNGGWNIIEFYKDKFLMMFLIIVMSKSAQYPFSIWLPLAMTAPTPVSALVHSSTLVTAGVYFLMRGIELLEEWMLGWLMILSLFTMFYSSLMANFENDIKKIVALSTLSQLGLMMFILCFKYKILCFFHLVTHAFFKSLLFMCVGYIMHLMMGFQDIRCMKFLHKINPMVLMMMIYSLLSMCGFFFLSGFYSKDLILEYFFMSKISYFYLIIFYISCMFTVSYSFRLIILMLMGNSKNFSIMSLIDYNMKLCSMIVLWLMSLILGSLMSWMFISGKVMILFGWEKKVILMILILGVIFLGLVTKLEDKMLFSKMYYFISSMWFLDLILSIYINKVVNYLKLEFMFFEKGWGEYMLINWVNELNKIMFFMSFMMKKVGFILLIFVIVMLV
uniref:NADH:ubiquinone reductase (H(+)-translocating) n=1 Tax=Parevania sp. ZJUH_2016024 TaxID=2491165 RepID=A0A3S8V139_9HYME|nr:NADH dehydrogenase subunit 5 [Parevania sp. ZJUH_2016024]